jgi:hypothetical protein
MLYYTKLSSQRLGLEQSGFSKNAVAYDNVGKRIENDTIGNSITFVARIPK